MTVVGRDYVVAFWARVDKSDPDGCWIWTGLLDDYGYGRATYGRRLVDLAHRVSWRIEFGEIPEGVCILHHCDNPPCVRPVHLFDGDRGDNARDMSTKGRQYLQQHPERALRGEAHGNHRLTEVAIREIRRRRACGERLRTIAAVFQTTDTTVSLVARRRAWAHVEDVS